MIQSYNRFLTLFIVPLFCGVFMVGCGTFELNNRAARSQGIIDAQQQVARLERLNKINTADAAELHANLVFARSIVISPDSTFDFSRYCAGSLSNLECVDSVLKKAEEMLIEAQ